MFGEETGPGILPGKCLLALGVAGHLQEVSSGIDDPRILGLPGPSHRPGEKIPQTEEEECDSERVLHEETSGDGLADEGKAGA